VFQIIDWAGGGDVASEPAAVQHFAFTLEANVASDRGIEAPGRSMMPVMHCALNLPYAMQFIIIEFAANFAPSFQRPA